MANRSTIYEGDYESPYPPYDEQIHKKCDICGIDMVVNNWPDRKSRTPIFKGFIVCPECDPRAAEDHYKKEGYRIIHGRRMRIIKMAQVTRSVAKHPCFNRQTMGQPRCRRCAACVALNLFPPF